MRIGVDARCLSVPLTGIGRYTEQLLSRMTVRGGKWFLYSNRDLLPNMVFEGDVIVRDGRMPRKAMSTVWSQSVLPWVAGRDLLDIFWSPRHHLPLFLNPKVKQVVTIHDLVWRHAPETMRGLSRLLDAFLMPRAIRMADGVIAVSEQTASDIVSELPDVPGEKIRVIYEGASLVEPLPSAHLREIGIDGKFILFVGTLEPRKNLRRLLQAYGKLEHSLRERFRLVIAGGKGWGREDIPSVIRELGIEEATIVLGYVSDKTLATLYKYAELLVMPSLFEGFGLPLVEAMSSGTPVLTSDRSSMKEIAGDAGILVDPFDVASIVEGLTSILSNDGLRSRLSRAGLERAKDFSWERAATETMSFFNDLMMRESVM